MIEFTSKQNINNDNFFRMLEEKIGSSNSAYLYLKDIISNRNLYDYSGHSGDATLIVNKADGNQNGYVIKISKNGNLREEYIAYNFFYRIGLTSKPYKYFKCGNYEIMVVSKIDLPLVDMSFEDYLQKVVFLAKGLRKLHDSKLIEHKFTNEERKYFETKYINNFNQAMDSKEGLVYLKDYIDDKDIDETKKYLIKHKDVLFRNSVLVHGDFGQTNVFVENDKGMKIIDFKNVGIVNKHYDIFWSLFLTILFAGILNDREKVNECKKLFFNSYGLEQINEEEYEFFKRYSYLYWKQHDNVVRFENL